ncbi:major facilitator superfamily protein [Striga asiatica]|uniref:Major facilitator superfamily protein n=1 Tax=Striga asiatica TaxID=4170 RepID=A0A5A7P7X1_STRAF|nr:major facilitator superfamily protein [Striga asiatica]
MGVVIESEVWKPNQAVFIFLFISCVLSIICLPTKSAANVIDQAPLASFLRFRHKFMFLYTLASVIEGLWTVFGEYELAYFGLSKEQMLTSLSFGYAVSTIIGSFLGVLSDLVGHKKLCSLFYLLHICLAVWKIVVGSPYIWFASLSLSLASSIYSFSFETWMVVEHEKLGQRPDSLNDMFWSMTFFGSASFIGSQMLANYLIDDNVNKNIKSTWKGAVILAAVGIIYTTRGSKEAPQIATFRDYLMSLHRQANSDKRIWLLAWIQSCVHFSVASFWILWAPTIVADGREVLLGLIYPCLLGSKMLGSAIYPWFFHGRLMLRIEEYLLYAFIIMGLALSVVAYDYQEIGVLVSLFCIFHACEGVISPSLARLRTMYVPNEVRGGIMSLSLMPANAAILVCLVLRGYYQVIANSTIIFFAVLGLFSAAGCMHLLKKWGKQLHHSRHHL